MSTQVPGDYEELLERISHLQQELAVYTDNPVRINASIGTNHLNLYATYEISGYSHLRVFDSRDSMSSDNIRYNAVQMAESLGGEAEGYHVFVFYYGTNAHQTLDYYFSPRLSYLSDMAYEPIGSGNHSMLIVVSNVAAPMLTCQRMNVQASILATHGNISASDVVATTEMQCLGWYAYHTILINGPFYHLADVTGSVIRYFRADYYSYHESEDHTYAELPVELSTIYPG